MCATSGCGCDLFPVIQPTRGKDEELKSPPATTTGGIKVDLLARVVGIQRSALEVWQSWLESALANPTFRTLASSSQSVHILASAAVGMVCGILYTGGQGSGPRPSQFLSVLYILSTALHIGAQFWMTFVSGLTLYFSLSRHAFGDVQEVLFPRYFTLNSLFSCVSLVSFAKLHQHLPAWSFNHYLQVSCLGAGFIVETLARLYMAPRVLKSMAKVRQLELQVEGVGKEVGCHVPRSLAQSPAYVAAYSTFRRRHSLMAVANLLSMACSVAHLFHLASAIQFT